MAVCIILYRCECPFSLVVGRESNAVRKTERIVVVVGGVCAVIEQVGTPYLYRLSLLVSHLYLACRRAIAIDHHLGGRRYEVIGLDIGGIIFYRSAQVVICQNRISHIDILADIVVLVVLIPFGSHDSVFTTLIVAGIMHLFAYSDRSICAQIVSGGKGGIHIPRTYLVFMEKAVFGIGQTLVGQFPVLHKVGIVVTAYHFPIGCMRSGFCINVVSSGSPIAQELPLCIVIMRVCVVKLLHHRVTSEDRVRIRVDIAHLGHQPLPAAPFRSGDGQLIINMELLSRRISDGSEKTVLPCLVVPDMYAVSCRPHQIRQAVTVHIYQVVRALRSSLALGRTVGTDTYLHEPYRDTSCNTYVCVPIECLAALHLSAADRGLLLKSLCRHQHYQHSVVCLLHHIGNTVTVHIYQTGAQLVFRPVHIRTKSKTYLKFAG